MGFAQDLLSGLKGALGQLESEGGAVAAALRQRVEALEPQIEADAKAGEAAALALVRELFSGVIPAVAVDGPASARGDGGAGGGYGGHGVTSGSSTSSGRGGGGQL